MIDFVNTDIIKENKNIKIAVYSSSIEIANSKINELIKDEFVLKDINSKLNGRYVELLKNNITLIISTFPFNESIRGHKNNYSLVDEELLNCEKNLDFYNSRIKFSTVNYNVKEEFIDNDIEKRIIIY